MQFPTKEIRNKTIETKCQRTSQIFLKTIALKIMQKDALKRREII